MANPSQRTGSSAGRTIIAFIGAGVFLVACVVVAHYARQSQVSGELMNNGRGGHMAFADGYKIAFVMLLLSLVYAWRARTLTRRPLPN
jgi:hypothetical protein